MDKEKLREKNIQIRKKLDKNKASKVIVSKILNFKPFLSAKNILIYYPLKYEVDLLELLNIKDKNFYLPKTDGDNLLICPYCSSLRKSHFGVMEPCNNEIKDISLIELAFTPCLSVDKNLNRLGYGKGYYDRLFSKPDFKALKVGVIYKELIVDNIKTDIFDKKIDFVISD